MTSSRLALTVLLLSAVSLGYLMGAMVAAWSFARYAPARAVPAPLPATATYI